jgi:hypothetical protein
VKLLKEAFSKLKHLQRNNRRDILFFVGVWMTTANVRVKLQYLTGLHHWIVFWFSIVFVLACLYELCIKIGAKREFSKAQMVRDILRFDNGYTS